MLVTDESVESIERAERMHQQNGVENHHDEPTEQGQCFLLWSSWYQKWQLYQKLSWLAQRANDLQHFSQCGPKQLDISQKEFHRHYPKGYCRPPTKKAMGTVEGWTKNHAEQNCRGGQSGLALPHGLAKHLGELIHLVTALAILEKWNSNHAEWLILKWVGWE